MFRKPLRTKWNPLIDHKPISDSPGTKFSRDLTRRYMTKDTRGMIDLGCGTGGFIYAFDEHYHCFGLDIDPNALKVAKKYCVNSQFVVATVSDLPFRDETFGFTTAWGVMEELEEGGEMKLIDEIYRILTPGGLFLLSTANDHILFKLMNPASLIHRYTHYNAKKLMKSLEERKFSIEECTIRGRWYSLIAISIFYFYKHILHKPEGRMLRYVHKKIENEFESTKEGIYSIYLAAKKEGGEKVTKG
jgi:ubiquinone/menaquinone biosynthesis C-methylase UbiE